MLAAVPIVAIFATLFQHQAAALSYPLCDTYGESWVTASPHLEGSFPYYSLLFSCTGSLNIEGFEIDACIKNGTLCGQAAADAVCQYLGFDGNSKGMYNIATASAPAFSMTGEWCTSPGSYQNLGHPNRTQWEAYQAAFRGPYCQSLTSVTCYRGRGSLSSSIDNIVANALLAPAPSMSSYNFLPKTGSPAVQSAGRKLLSNWFSEWGQ
jgi:hypothetical protein